MKHTNESTFPGPGDEITWPPYTGHPNDPRWEDEPEDDDEEPFGDPYEYHESFGG